ncbi:60S ribosomal protein [Mycena kentingensis (nom. inval.)]|nr:60S ribosomal protein [Mycena kentingensis (nom. inval.)]
MLVCSILCSPDHQTPGHLCALTQPLSCLFTTMTRQIVVERPLLEIGCTLGPVYDPKTSVLHFVDIDEGKVRRIPLTAWSQARVAKIIHYNTVNLGVEVEEFDEKIGCIALRRNGPGLAGAAAQGFALFPGNSQKDYISRPLPVEHQPYTRFNDGGCDSKGRFFAGTMYDKARNIPGELWRFDPSDGSCTVVDPGPFTDSNGMGWTADEKTFYFTDSIENIIYAYDYHDGELSNRRVFVDAMAVGLARNSFADGLCVDMDGYVWSARWGGSRVVRFSPDGQIDLEVVIPSVLNVTSCAFGGPENDLLYITTAHCKASGEETMQREFMDSGHLFVVQTEVKGVARYPFGL